MLVLLLACCKLLVKLFACGSSEGWGAGCQVQLVEGVVAESLLRHAWSICLLGCRLCEFWSVSRSRVRSIVEWRDVWVQFALPFLRIQFLWPCSCHLMSLCGSWRWSCWCSGCINIFSRGYTYPQMQLEAGRVFNMLASEKATQKVCGTFNTSMAWTWAEQLHCSTLGAMDGPRHSTSQSTLWKWPKQALNINCGTQHSRLCSTLDYSASTQCQQQRHWWSNILVVNTIWWFATLARSRWRTLFTTARKQPREFVATWMPKHGLTQLTLGCTTPRSRSTNVRASWTQASSPTWRKMNMMFIKIDPTEDQQPGRKLQHPWMNGILNPQRCHELSQLSVTKWGQQHPST